MATCVFADGKFFDPDLSCFSMACDSDKTVEWVFCGLSKEKQKLFTENSCSIYVLTEFVI